MLRFAVSFFASNTKQTTSNDEEYSLETVINVVSNPAENSEDSLIQSLRQKKQQELIQKILLRKVSHQAIMSHYAQDHLPLSRIQEKLEEDNLPLTVLQEKLKQRDDISINATTKENINFLLYNKSPSRRLLTIPRKIKPRKPKPALNTPVTNDRAPTPKDDRDYDVWDDAMIGHLMNLVDTIGIDTIQEEIAREIPKVGSELVKEVINDVINDRK